MKLTNTRLDKALDRLYDVLSKNPPGTSFNIRLKRFLRTNRPLGESNIEKGNNGNQNK